ncbi:MAG TPA: chemotaxis protein CheB, partial [Burkholderiales bacterium]|nr:chemotaxis protein CheB [Burkholderiales bacterium]
MQAPSPSSSAEARIPVVGIGASAGGLEAIGELLAALPAKMGMAFLVVLHLDPDRASMLADLLGKKTEMPVTEVVDGMTIEQDHVYIIPPNRFLALEQNGLHLQPRPQQRYPSMPVDVLFASIAKERGHDAIGIILSGHGSDGARGVRAIQETGGITFAQDDASAAFPGMPRAAVATGCVDFVLSPSAIAAKLTELREHPYIRQLPAPASD